MDPNNRLLKEEEEKFEQLSFEELLKLEATEDDYYDPDLWESK